MPEKNSQTYDVSGMHCASCVSLIERKIAKIPGVKAVSVNLASETATIETHKLVPLNVFNQVLKPYGYRFSVAHQHLTPPSHALPLSFYIALIAIGLMIWEIASKRSIPIILFMLSTINIFMFGRTFLIAIPRFIRTGYANMDTLVGIGSVAAYLYSSFILFFGPVAASLGLPSMYYFDVPTVVIGFILLGKHLEKTSRSKAGDAIQKLLNLQAKNAILIDQGQQREVSISQLKVGDILLVKPGAKIPTDAIIVQGSTAIDESAVTGEALPVEKTVHDQVIGGTVNTHSAIHIKVTKTGSQTVLAQIIDMVEAAQRSKAPIERLVDRISAVFVPTILVIAVIASVSWIVGGHSLVAALTSFISILVIACPCAMGLATPTGIIAGVGKGAENGILIKDAESIEKLQHIDTVVIDKTGTLTLGKPMVVTVEPAKGFTVNQIIETGASLEALSDHPLAKAIALKAHSSKVKTFAIAESTNYPGQGIMGKHGKDTYVVGNRRFMNSLDIKIAEDLPTIPGATRVYLAKNHQYMGSITIADQIRGTAPLAIKHLRQSGIDIVVATGDNAATAQYIAQQLHINQVESDMLPQDKARLVKQLQQQGRRVAMVGDGINDAPALAAADVSIAMSNGSDIAIEAANITLLHGDISKLWHAIKLAKQTMAIIQQNLFWAFIYNSIGIPLAAANLLNPMIAGSAMALSSVSVVANSLRLKQMKL